MPSNHYNEIPFTCSKDIPEWRYEKQHRVRNYHKFSKGSSKSGVNQSQIYFGIMRKPK